MPAGKTWEGDLGGGEEEGESESGGRPAPREGGEGAVALFWFLGGRILLFFFCFEIGPKPCKSAFLFPPHVCMCACGER